MYATVTNEAKRETGKERSFKKCISKGKEEECSWCIIIIAFPVVFKKNRF